MNDLELLLAWPLVGMAAIITGLGPGTRHGTRDLGHGPVGWDPGQWDPGQYVQYCVRTYSNI